MPRRALASLPLLLVALALAACGGDGPDTTATTAATTPAQRPTIVATNAILGSVTSAVVGDAADVVVLVPNGTDPHEWSPSAKDATTVRDADLVVANGLGLEESLHDVLDTAAADGVPVFTAGDHVDVRTVGPGELSDEGEGTDDPHLWTSPQAMAQVVAALGPAITAATGLDVTAGTAREVADLNALDAEAEALLASVPADRRRLVTGHESLGYFADRYGFELIGAVIPSLSSQAEASAQDIAELDRRIRDAGVAVVFTELGTPSQVARTIADETGARVVELPTHALPAGGGYDDLIRTLATRVRDALVS